MDMQHENLRELLERHRRPAAWLCEVLGLSRATIYMHVLARGRLSDKEILALARALDVPREAIFAAVDETRVRPGEDARGRKMGWRKATGQDSSLGGEKKNGDASIVAEQSGAGWNGAVSAGV